MYDQESDQYPHYCLECGLKQEDTRRADIYNKEVVLKSIYEDTRDLGIFKRESISERIQHILADSKGSHSSLTADFIRKNTNLVQQAVHDGIIRTRGLTNVQLVCLATMKQMEDLGHSTIEVKRALGFRNKNMFVARRIFESQMTALVQNKMHSQIATLMQLPDEELHTAIQAEQYIEQLSSALTETSITRTKLAVIVYIIMKHGLKDSRASLRLIQSKFSRVFPGLAKSRYQVICYLKKHALFSAASQRRPLFFAQSTSHAEINRNAFLRAEYVIMT